jgi:hypothetical protein
MRYRHLSLETDQLRSLMTVFWRHLTRWLLALAWTDSEDSVEVTRLDYLPVNLWEI